MMGVKQRMVGRLLVRGLVCLGLVGITADQAWSDATVWPVQMPYEAPPKSEPVPDVSVAPNTKALTPEELQRAEALFRESVILDQELAGVLVHEAVGRGAVAVVGGEAGILGDGRIRAPG